MLNGPQLSGVAGYSRGSLLDFFSPMIPTKVGRQKSHPKVEGNQIHKTGYNLYASVSCCTHAVFQARTGIGKLPRQGDTANGELRAFDVAPILRRFLTRADDYFDDRLSLTLCDELVRGQVPKRAVRPTLIVVHAPGFDEGLRLGERGELMHVQALVP